MNTLGEKRWKWYDQRCFRYKVGVVVYENAVVVHAPQPLGDMDLRWFDDPDRADAYGQLVKRGLRRLRDDVVEHPGPNDNTAVHEVLNA